MADSGPNGGSGFPTPVADEALVRCLREQPDVIVVIDGDGRLEWANRSAERLFERSVQDSMGMSGLDLVHPEDLELVMVSLVTIQTKVVGTPIEIRLRTAAGWRLFELVGTPVPWVHEGAVLLSLRDLTDRRRFELSHDEDSRFRTLVQSAAAVTMLVSPDGILQSCSGALTRMLGHDSEQIEGKPLVDLVVDKDRSSVLAAIDRASLGAVTANPVTVTVELLRSGSDTSVPFELSLVNLVDDPTVAGYVVSAHDVTERRRLEAQLLYQAFHDSLTALGNRFLFQNQLEGALARMRRSGQQLAVFFVDVDDLKAVNDTFGHSTGDLLLRAVADRLSTCLRGADMAARLGGDEFGVIAEGLKESHSAVILAERMLKACREPVMLDRVLVSTSVSIGIAVGSAESEVEQLVSNADRAMYSAKAQGRNRCVLREDEALALGSGTR